MTRYDAVVADSTTPEELLDAFAAKLAETLRDEAPMHRLWYDLRTQSMFEDALREAVTMIDRTLEEMIWRVVSRYAELAGRSVVDDLGHGVRDARRAVPAGPAGDVAVDPDAALDRIAGQVHVLMPLLLAPAGTDG